MLEQTGQMPAQLDVPPVPYELMHVWEYFIQINSKRTAGAMVMNPLSDEQIMAWQRRHGLTLTPFESDCIDALDVVYLNAGAAGPG